jgi:hypothetical protein
MIIDDICRIMMSMLNEYRHDRLDIIIGINYLYQSLRGQTRQSIDIGQVRQRRSNSNYDLNTSIIFEKHEIAVIVERNR